jgi:hypothetical protein
MQLQLVATLAAAILLLVILEFVRRRQLLERYALLWLATGVTLVLLGAWRGLLTTVSEAVGIAAPANALFAAGLVLLLVLVLDLSVAVSRLSDQSRVLAQRAAILEQRLHQLEKSVDDASSLTNR